MKVVLLTNSDESKKLYSWLKDKKDLDVLLWQNKIEADFISSHQPELLISYNYRYIIRPDVISLMSDRIINLHISYLPWNRGAYPNVWSFLKDTPKGVTIHLIDEGLDTGDILYQEKIEFNEAKETLASSYSRLHEKIYNLFIENWEQIKNFKWNRKKQIGSGSINYVKDFERIAHLISDLNWDTPISTLKQKYNKLIEGDKRA